MSVRRDADDGGRAMRCSAAKKPEGDPRPSWSADRLRPRRARNFRLLLVPAACHLLLGPLVEDHVLISSLVHADRDDLKALGIALPTVQPGAIVILLSSFGVQLLAAGDTVRHYAPNPSVRWPRHCLLPPRTNASKHQGRLRYFLAPRASLGAIVPLFYPATHGNSVSLTAPVDQRLIAPALP